MLPSEARLSRSQFSQFLLNKRVVVVYNRLGTLKYVPSMSLQLSVVTSSKAEKKAVSRNTLRRRIYTVFGSLDPHIQGIVYVSKQSYAFSYSEIKALCTDLVARARKAP